MCTVLLPSGVNPVAINKYIYLSFLSDMLHLVVIHSLGRASSHSILLHLNMLVAI